MVFSFFLTQTGTDNRFEILEVLLKVFIKRTETINITMHVVCAVFLHFIKLVRGDVNIEFISRFHFYIYI